MTQISQKRKSFCYSGSVKSADFYFGTFSAARRMG